MDFFIRIPPNFGAVTASTWLLREPIDEIAAVLSLEKDLEATQATIKSMCSTLRMIGAETQETSADDGQQQSDEMSEMAETDTVICIINLFLSNSRAPGCAR
jgi:hypothetical protein